MNYDYQSGRSRNQGYLRLGQLGLALLIIGCSGSDGAVLNELLAGLHDAPSGGPPSGGQGGSGGPRPGECVVFLTADSVYAQVANDLRSRDAEDALFARYLSLADQANVNGCGSALDGARAALNKLVNSLSTDPSITTPVAVDADRTLYRIDLRDYNWDRSIEVSNVVFADAWEAIIASSPYAVPFVGDDADDAAADTGTSVPVLFGDAFVAAASRAPLYYALLGVPADIDDFLADDLDIDVAEARAGGGTVRAGFVGLAPNRAGGEFVAERFDMQIRTGYVWQISELGRRSGALFADPLGDARGERELVFTLPNGLLGHVIAGANGRVRSVSDVVLDPAEGDQLAKIAHSYMREHAQGVQVTDQVRQFALDNPSSFTSDELEAILELYVPEAELEAFLARDRAVVATALERAQLDIEDSPEPISNTFVEFASPVDLATAAGALLLSAEDLRDNLPLLEPELSVLDGASVARGDFDGLYVESLCRLSVVLDNQPDPDVCANP